MTPSQRESAESEDGVNGTQKAKTQTTYTDETIHEYEESLSYDKWTLWKKLQRNEAEFAKNAGWHYGRYWETMTIQQLIEAQS